MTAPDYRVVLRRLTALEDAAAAHRDEATGWHDDAVGAVEEAIGAAEENVRAAAEAVRAARRDLEAVDARAAGLWSEYVHRVGPPAERYGRTVPPPSVPRQRDDRDADAYLREVATTIAYSPPARPLGGGATALFAGFGLAGGALGLAGRELLRWAGHAAGGGLRTGLPVLGLVVLLLGPVLAVFAAKRVADRRGVALTAAAIVTVLVAGLVAAALLYAVLPAAARP
jgi:hypothetical protein